MYSFSAALLYLRLFVFYLLEIELLKVNLPHLAQIQVFVYSTHFRLERNLGSFTCGSLRILDLAC